MFIPMLRVHVVVDSLGSCRCHCTGWNGDARDSISGGCSVLSRITRPSQRPAATSLMENSPTPPSGRAASTDSGPVAQRLNPLGILSKFTFLRTIALQLWHMPPPDSVIAAIVTKQTTVLYSSSCSKQAWSGTF
jgi:hypothetical protein